MKYQVVLVFFMLFLIEGAEAAFAQTHEETRGAIAGQPSSLRLNVNAEVQIGKEKITLVCPDGYVNTQQSNPEVWKLIQTHFTPQTFNLLAFFISTRPNSSLPDQPVLDLNTRVQINGFKAAAALTENAQQFSMRKMEFKKSFEPGFAENRAQALKYLKAKNEAKQNKIQEDPPLDVKGFGVIEVADEGPQYLSLAGVIESSFDLGFYKSSSVQVCVLTVLLVKGKEVMIYVYTEFHSMEDLKKAAKISKEVIDGVISTNGNQKPPISTTSGKSAPKS